VKILFDTNVVLDVLLDREPFSTQAALLFSRVEQGELIGCLCATTVTTVHYLAGKVLGEAQARIQIGKLLRLFAVAPVNRTVLEAALRSPMRDFEDAVIHEAALHISAQGLVTRDGNDFKGAKLPVYSPADLLRALQAAF
jgi:predicted nucleic acid-binding protein